jgi:ubiquinone/menaquinone biosynthesis C-methylase UbiE
MQAAQGGIKGYKGLPMEGIVAHWYARNRGSRSQLEAWTRQAARVTGALPDGAAVLEVAPGPGYFAIELARSGRVHVTALDISHTFVEIATQNAHQAGVQVDFREGDASRMPFAAGSFDLVICQAAFKNFSRPVVVLDEMHRVLRDGGTAVIEDLCKDTSAGEIAREVRTMGQDPLNAFMTRQALGSLRRRAYTRQQFERLASASAFHGGTIRMEGIGLEVRLTKATAA